MTKIKLPKKVKIGYATYNIKFPYTFYNNGNFAGLHEGPWHSIKISNIYNDHEISSQRALTIFMHELIHAIDFVYSGQCLSEHEHTVESFASAFIQIFRDNNLYLRSDTIPKSVRVGGVVYNIVYPFDFWDSPDFVNVSCNHGIHEIYLGKESDNREFSHEYVKFSLIYTIIHAMIVVYDIENFASEGNGIDYNLLNPFAGGVYQTFRDNKIDNVIRHNLDLAPYKE